MKHYSRRRVLQVAGLVALSNAAGQLLSVPRVFAAQLTPAAPSLAVFLRVSQQLTQQSQLNPTVAQALVQALNLTQKDFPAGLAQLDALLSSQPALLQQDKLVFPEQNAASEKLAKSILGGWYNGVVGKGNNALYVTYINTLANQAVKDKVVPPGFSYGPCGSWAQQP